jgi:hypothetical protein
MLVATQNTLVLAAADQQQQYYATVFRVRENWMPRQIAGRAKSQGLDPKLDVP